MSRMIVHHRAAPTVQRVEQAAVVTRNHTHGVVARAADVAAAVESMMQLSLLLMLLL